VNVDLNHQTLYFPFANDRSPFPQALTVTISLRLRHDSALTLATDTLCTGTKWTAYAGSYFYGPIAETSQRGVSIGTKTMMQTMKQQLFPQNGVGFGDGKHGKQALPEQCSRVVD
jgi:hypothetical protein